MYYIILLGKSCGNSPVRKKYNTNGFVLTLLLIYLKSRLSLSNEELEAGLLSLLHYNYVYTIIFMTCFSIFFRAEDIFSWQLPVR